MTIYTLTLHKLNIKHHILHINQYFIVLHNKQMPLRYFLT